MTGYNTNLNYVEECSAVGTFWCCSGGFQPAVNESRDNQRAVGSTHLRPIPTGFGNKYNSHIILQCR